MLQLVRLRGPHTVYDPIRYLLRSSGKRVRPVLTVLACEAVGGRAAAALDAAAAIEALHGFTLVHDDIMDNADTRRGLQTIHRKWNDNVAILAGDEMIALAYHSLLKTKTRKLAILLRMFTEAFIEVCEGQGLDNEFERRLGVSLREYLHMIDKKTAKMISTAAALGAMIGGGSKQEVNALGTYGEQLGRAFQIQDDLLDIVADELSFGKSIGGDLKQGKKTYLLLRGIERTRGKERRLLEKVARRSRISIEEVRKIKEIFERHGIIDEAQALVRNHTRRAQQALAGLGPTRAKEMLALFADELVARTS